MARHSNGITGSDLKRFAQLFEDVLKLVPNAKKAALYAGAAAAQQEVRREIGQRVNDSHGRVRRWQEVVMGDKGGYSKVALSKAQVATHGKYRGYTAAQITGYINHGHGVRGASGRSKRYEARESDRLVQNRNAKRRDAYGSYLSGVVPGRQFYSYSSDRAAEAALAAMYEKMDQLADDWADFLYENS